MISGEDESSVLNGRLRPRKSTAAIPNPPNKSTHKSETKVVLDKPKKNGTPSKASPNKQDDLTVKAESSSHAQFLCPYCDKKFTTKLSSFKHAQRIHLSSSKQDNVINCLFCSQTEVALTDIIRHMVDSHPHQYFACLDCNTRFLSTSELAEHKLNVCEKQKQAYRSKLRQKTSTVSKKDQKKIDTDTKNPSENKDFEEKPGFNGLVISCELNPSQVNDAVDIEDKITTNLILPSNIGNTVIEKNAMIILDDIHRLKRIPPNFTFRNADADQILSRLGVVHRSPRVGESSRREWLKMIDDSSQKFEKCFDTHFYSRVASNVQENLARFLDGSFNFSPDPDKVIKTRKSKSSAIINTAEGFPILLPHEQYSRNRFDGYMPRAIAPKHKWKWDSTENEKNIIIDPNVIKRDNHVDNCIITFVSSLDIWTQLRMRRKFEGIFCKAPTEKIEKQNIIAKQLKEILESREIPGTSSEVVKYTSPPASTPATAVNTEFDFPNILGLTARVSGSEEPVQTVPTVLSGEWVRPRCYVCCACGDQTRESRALTTHMAAHHPNAQVQHYEIVGESLLNADILKHLYVPPSQMFNRTRPLRGFRDCTKCKKSVTIEDLHQHMLDCAGDTPTVRRKCRSRPFGVRRRRPRLTDKNIRKKIRKDMRTRHNQKGLLRARPKIRTEVGDAETIRKMLADLPAKRHRQAADDASLKVLRPRRKIDKQRNKLKIKLSSKDDKPEKVQTKIDTNDSSIIDEDDQPLKPKTKLEPENTASAKKRFSSRVVASKNKKSVKELLPISNENQQDSSTDNVSVFSQPQENTTQQLNINVKNKHKEGDSDTGGNGDIREKPPGEAPDKDDHIETAPDPNLLKHSINNITALTLSKVLQPQQANTEETLQDTRKSFLENEVASSILDKPPLQANLKSSSEKKRQSLLNCIEKIKSQQKMDSMYPKNPKAHVTSIPNTSFIDPHPAVISCTRDESGAAKNVVPDNIGYQNERDIRYRRSDIETQLKPNETLMWPPVLPYYTPITYGPEFAPPRVKLPSGGHRRKSFATRPALAYNSYEHPSQFQYNLIQHQWNAIHSLDPATYARMTQPLLQQPILPLQRMPADNVLLQIQANEAIKNMYQYKHLNLPLPGQYNTTDINYEGSRSHVTQRNETTRYPNISSLSPQWGRESTQIQQMSNEIPIMLQPMHTNEIVIPTTRGTAQKRVSESSEMGVYGNCLSSPDSNMLNANLQTSSETNANLYVQPMSQGYKETPQHYNAKRARAQKEVNFQETPEFPNFSQDIYGYKNTHTEMMAKATEHYPSAQIQTTDVNNQEYVAPIVVDERPPILPSSRNTVDNFQPEGNKDLIPKSLYSSNSSKKKIYERYLTEHPRLSPSVPKETQDTMIENDLSIPNFTGVVNTQGSEPVIASKINDPISEEQSDFVLSEQPLDLSAKNKPTGYERASLSGSRLEEYNQTASLYYNESDLEIEVDEQQGNEDFPTDLSLKRNTMSGFSKNQHDVSTMVEQNKSDKVPAQPYCNRSTVTYYEEKKSTSNTTNIINENEQHPCLINANDVGKSVMTTDFQPMLDSQTSKGPAVNSTLDKINVNLSATQENPRLSGVPDATIIEAIIKFISSYRTFNYTEGVENTNVNSTENIQYRSGNCMEQNIYEKFLYSTGITREQIEKFMFYHKILQESLIHSTEITNVNEVSGTSTNTIHILMKHDPVRAKKIASFPKELVDLLGAVPKDHTHKFVDIISQLLPPAKDKVANPPENTLQCVEPSDKINTPIIDDASTNNGDDKLITNTALLPSSSNLQLKNTMQCVEPSDKVNTALIDDASTYNGDKTNTALLPSCILIPENTIKCIEPSDKVHTTSVNDTSTNNGDNKLTINTALLPSSSILPKKRHSPSANIIAQQPTSTDTSIPDSDLPTVSDSTTVIVKNNSLDTLFNHKSIKEIIDLTDDDSNQPITRPISPKLNAFLIQDMIAKPQNVTKNTNDTTASLRSVRIKTTLVHKTTSDDKPPKGNIEAYRQQSPFHYLQQNLINAEQTPYSEINKSSLTFEGTASANTDIPANLAINEGNTRATTEKKNNLTSTQTYSFNSNTDSMQQISAVSYTGVSNNVEKKNNTEQNNIEMHCNMEQYNVKERPAKIDDNEDCGNKQKKNSDFATFLKSSKSISDVACDQKNFSNIPTVSYVSNNKQDVFDSTDHSYDGNSEHAAFLGSDKSISDVACDRSLRDFSNISNSLAASSVCTNQDTLICDSVDHKDDLEINASLDKERNLQRIIKNIEKTDTEMFLKPAVTILEEKLSDIADEKHKFNLDLDDDDMSLADILKQKQLGLDISSLIDTNAAVTKERTENITNDSIGSTEESVLQLLPTNGSRNITKKIKIAEVRNIDTSIELDKPQAEQPIDNCTVKSCYDKALQNVNTRNQDHEAIDYVEKVTSKGREKDNKETPISNMSVNQTHTSNSEQNNLKSNSCVTKININKDIEIVSGVKESSKFMQADKDLDTTIHYTTNKTTFPNNEIHSSFLVNQAAGEPISKIKIKSIEMCDLPQSQIELQSPTKIESENTKDAKNINNSETDQSILLIDPLLSIDFNDDNKRALRSSKRGKSMFSDHNDPIGQDTINTIEIYHDPTQNIKESQIIFSKLISENQKCEININATKNDDEVKVATTVQTKLCANRKRSLDKAKNKKKKSINQLTDEDTDNLNYDTDNICQVKRSKMNDKDDNTSNLQQESKSEYSTNDTNIEILAKDYDTEMIKNTEVTESTQAKSNISEYNVDNNVHVNTLDYSDNKKQLDKTNTSAEIRTACYNRPILSKLTCSTSEQAQHPDNYDPYNIDFDIDMAETTQPIVKRKSNKTLITTTKSKNNLNFEDPVDKIHYETDSAKHLLAVPTSASICDSDSSISDAPLQKYVEEKEKLKIQGLKSSDSNKSENYPEPNSTLANKSESHNDFCELASTSGNVNLIHNNDDQISEHNLEIQNESNLFTNNTDETLMKDDQSHSNDITESTIIQIHNADQIESINETSTVRSNIKPKKNRRSASCNKLETSNVSDETELASDKCMENFGFFSVRKPRKSNLLASKKISETFNMIESDEADFRAYDRQRRSSHSETRRTNDGASTSNATQDANSDETRMSTVQNPINDDGEVDLITAQRMLESDEIRKLERDLYFGFKEAAEANAGKTSGFNHLRAEQTLVYENNNKDLPVPIEIEKIKSPEIPESPESTESLLKDKPLMYPEEEVNIYEDKYDIIKRRREASANAKQVQKVDEPRKSKNGKTKKKPDKKNKKSTKKLIYQGSQVPTKGALKVFESLKVSIPTQDFNMPPNITSLHHQRQSRAQKRKISKKSRTNSGSSCKSDSGVNSKFIATPDVYEFQDDERPVAKNYNRLTRGIDECRSSSSEYENNKFKKQKYFSSPYYEKDHAKEPQIENTKVKKGKGKGKRTKNNDTNNVIETSHDERKKNRKETQTVVQEPDMKGTSSCLSYESHTEQRTDDRQSVAIDGNRLINDRSNKSETLQNNEEFFDDSDAEMQTAIPGSSGFVPDRNDESSYESDSSSRTPLFSVLKGPYACTCLSEIDSDDSETERGCAHSSCRYSHLNAAKNAVMGKIFKNNAVRCEKPDDSPQASPKPKPDLDRLFDSLLETNTNNPMTVTRISPIPGPSSATTNRFKIVINCQKQIIKTLRDKKVPKVDGFPRSPNHRAVEKYSIRESECTTQPQPNNTNFSRVDDNSFDNNFREKSVETNDSEQYKMFAHKNIQTEDLVLVAAPSTSDQPMQQELALPGHLKTIAQNDYSTSEDDIDNLDNVPESSDYFAIQNQLHFKKTRGTQTKRYFPKSDIESSFFESELNASKFAKRNRRSNKKHKSHHKRNKLCEDKELVRNDHHVDSDVTSAKQNCKSQKTTGEKKSGKRYNEKQALSKKPDEGIRISLDNSADAHDMALTRDSGLAVQRARRKCTVGKQNVLAEHWSSSESETEVALNRVKGRKSSLIKKSNRVGKKHRASMRFLGGESDVDESDESRARRPKARSRTKSSAAARDRDRDSDAERDVKQEQHGWIVGHSHKKLMTMLACCKSKPRLEDKEKEKPIENKNVLEEDTEEDTEKENDDDNENQGQNNNEEETDDESDEEMEKRRQ